MAKTLDFNKIKKKYLTVVLADEKNTTLIIGTPTKAIMDELISLKSAFDDISEDDIDSETMDEIYTVCAKLMSRNKTGKKITKEQLEKEFDFEDMLIFFNAYMDFITEISGEKN